MRRQCSSGKRVIRQGLRHCHLDQLGRLAEPHAAEPSEDLASFALGSGKVFLGINATSRRLPAGTWLPAGVRKELGGTLDQAHAGIGDDQVDTAQAASLRWARKALQPALSFLDPSTLPSIWR